MYCLAHNHYAFRDASEIMTGCYIERARIQLELWTKEFFPCDAHQNKGEKQPFQADGEHIDNAI